MHTSTPSRSGGSALVGSILLASVAGGLFLPLSIVYFTALTDVSLELVGTLISAASATGIPIPLCAGYLADRFGARSILIGAQVLQCVSYLAYGWVHGPVGIFLASAVGAIGGRFYWSSIFTLIVDYADHNPGVSKDVLYARANIARTVGIGVGGLVTGLAVTDGSTAVYRAIAYAAAACVLLAVTMLVGFLRLPRTHRAAPTPATGYRSLFRDRAFLGFTAVNSCYAISTLFLGTALPTFVRSALRGPGWMTSSVLVGNAIVIAVLGGPITARLARRRRTRTMCAAGVLWTGWSLTLGAIAHGHGWWALTALTGATLLCTLAEVMHAPASMAIVAASAPAETRGRYLAVFQYSFVAAEVIIPVFFTTLFGLDHALPFLALAGVNVVAIVATLRLERHLPRHAVSAEERTLVGKG